MDTAGVLAVDTHRVIRESLGEMEIAEQPLVMEDTFPIPIDGDGCLDDYPLLDLELDNLA